MAKKSALFGGRTVKVENRSGFDKSFLNMLTTGVGTLTPLVRQLVIPSSGRCSIPVHVELPPLAADAYLRSHLKLEAFYTPLRVLYGGFQSWFCGEPIYDDESRKFVRAKLPFGFIPSDMTVGEETYTFDYSPEVNPRFGAGSLSDYFDLRFYKNSDGAASVPSMESVVITNATINGLKVNLFPYLNYHFIYDHFYRNKSVTRPGFAPQSISRVGIADKIDNACHLPFQASSATRPLCVCLGSDMTDDDGNYVAGEIADADLDVISGDGLLNGYHLCELRQRNYGDDYFTAARPTAQGDNPASVLVDNGRFTISAFRLANALTEFSENQNYATPDYVQTNMARYGVAPSDAIVQKPVLLGSSDFPIFTKSIQLNNNQEPTDGGNKRNPFANAGILGAKAGNANGNGTFSFDFDVKEPGYIMVIASLVPEANYASGIAKEMRIFTNGEIGGLADLPCSLLEHVGDEPILQEELNSRDESVGQNIFGYVQRYLWHKSGNVNQIHGLFRRGESLQAFVPMRDFDDNVEISTEFLEVPTTALDDVAAVDSGISEYGVMLDCAVELFVSEPLSESALPALANPASEHGRSVYLKNGGSKLS